MNYPELKIVIKHLKNVMPCTQCKKKFIDEGLKVLSTFNNEALFHFHCFQCGNQLIVHVAMAEEHQKNRLDIQTKTADIISKNDILDIHNFLNQFNGDFKKLFSA